MNETPATYVEAYNARVAKAHLAWVQLTGRKDITLEMFESLLAFKLLPTNRP